MKPSEQNLPEQPITCCSEMQRDVEGLAKTNDNDLIDKRGTKHRSSKHTHMYSYLYLLQSMAGGQSCKGVRDVPDFTLIVAVLSSLWENTHTPD